jgi:hypothetical protein
MDAIASPSYIPVNLPAVPCVTGRIRVEFQTESSGYSRSKTLTLPCKLAAAVQSLGKKTPLPNQRSTKETHRKPCQMTQNLQCVPAPHMIQQNPPSRSLLCRCGWAWAIAWARRLSRCLSSACSRSLARLCSCSLCSLRHACRSIYSQGCGFLALCAGTLASSSLSRYSWYGYT